MTLNEHLTSLKVTVLSVNLPKRGPITQDYWNGREYHSRFRTVFDLE